MKKNKIFLAAALSAAMMISMTACGGSGAAADDTTPAETAVNDTTSAGESDSVSADDELSEEEAWKQEPMYGQTLQYAYSGGNCVGAQHVANILGFYEEEGLSMEALASTSLMDAVATKQVVVTENHIAASAAPIINGLDAVIVGTAQTGCQSLYVLNDSEYQGTKDLVGKNVGIPNGYGSMDHNIVLRFMGHDGLNADDYNFKVVETTAVVQALQNGELDASLLSDQFAYGFVANGTLRAVRSLTTDEDFSEEPCCCVIMNGEFVRENPITAKKVARAIAKANAWIDSHTEESVQLMLDNGMMSMSDTSLQEKLEELQGSYDWTMTDAQCETTLRSIISDYQGFGIIDSSLDQEETLNTIWVPLLTDEELEDVWAEGYAFDANAQ